jgi:hypothetical protein
MECHDCRLVGGISEEEGKLGDCRGLWASDKVAEEDSWVVPMWRRTCVVEALTWCFYPDPTL